MHNNRIWLAIAAVLAALTVDVTPPPADAAPTHFTDNYALFGCAYIWQQESISGPPAWGQHAHTLTLTQYVLHAECVVTDQPTIADSVVYCSYEVLVWKSGAVTGPYYGVCDFI